ncbi:hypothetical protein ACJX0J_040777, partial [Zea mays]
MQKFTYFSFLICIIHMILYFVLDLIYSIIIFCTIMLDIEITNNKLTHVTGKWINKKTHDVVESSPTGDESEAHGQQQGDNAKEGLTDEGNNGVKYPNIEV